MLAEVSGVAALQQVLEHRLGLDFNGSRQPNLLSALTALAQERGASVDECARSLARMACQADMQAECARHFTVAETYFFRERRAFELVVDYAREKFSGQGPHARLRVWSAACCTGEEAYSAAIALQRALPAASLKRCSVLGTDINADSLRQAEAGVYGRRSFRNGETGCVHFTPIDEERLRVASPARDIVSFAQHNLASANWPMHLHGMDIILCRNVLMYFSPAQARYCIERLRDCLVEGGWLVVSPSEATLEMFAGFEVVRHPDAIWFRKTGATPLKADALPVQGATRAACRPAPERRLSAHRAPALIDEADRQRAHACCRQACTLAEANQVLEAETQLRRALYLDSQCVFAVCLLGLLLARQGHTRAARLQLEAALGLLLAMAPQATVPGSDRQACEVQHSVQAALAALSNSEALA